MNNGNKYSLAQMAVVVIIATEKPVVTGVLKHLSASEINLLKTNAKLMKNVGQEDLERILARFEDEFANGVGILGSYDQLNEVVDAGAHSDSDIGSESETPKPMPSQKSAWEIISEVEPRLVADFLSAEHPQVAAFILARLPASKASEIFALLDPENGLSIMAGIMNATDAGDGSNTLIESAISEKFGKLKTNDSRASLLNLASILNEMDRGASERYLAELAATEPEETLSDIKSMLFRFEDIVNLDAPARASVFDLVPVDQLTLALRDAAPEIIEAALSSIGQRSRRMIENDLKSKPAVRPADISSARKLIVAQIMRMSSQGQIELCAAPIAA
jgi:flagellar motor switch protein FliG